MNPMTFRAKPSIYYAGSLPLSAGGELVNFQHAAMLRKLGLRALMLLNPQSRIAVVSKPYPVPMVHWGEHLMFTEHDWLVVPEVMPHDTMARLARLPCHLVVHNQNPFYTFRGFRDIPAMNSAGLSGGLVCSAFVRETLQRWGSQTDWQVVRPYVLPQFLQTKPKKRQVAYMPRKRPQDVGLMRTLFSGLYPELADVPWIEINDMSRDQVAQVLAESLVFVSLSRHEGLGLPPLEAMASGCLVVGFDGEGGQEYATDSNGRWVRDGDVQALVHGLAQVLTLTPAQVAAQVKAGRETAAAFTPENFEAALARAWKTFLGESWIDYQIHAKEVAV